MIDPAEAVKSPVDPTLRRPLPPGLSPDRSWAIPPWSCCQSCCGLSAAHFPRCRKNQRRTPGAGAFLELSRRFSGASDDFHGLSGAIFRALAQGWRPYVGEDDAKLCWRGRCRRTAFGGSTSGRERAGASATGWRKGRRMAADLGWAAQGHWSRDGRGEGHICLHMLGAGNLCCALACRTSHEHLRIFQVRHVVGPQPATPGWAADLAAGPAVWPAVMLTDTVTPDQRHFRAGLRAFRMSFSLEGQVVFLLSRVGPGPVTQGPRP